jgi:hypothetical protein
VKDLTKAAHKIMAARGVLRDAGIDLAWRCPLTGPQVEELAAIVKNMLSEKPADYESEIKDNEEGGA